MFGCRRSRMYCVNGDGSSSYLSNGKFSITTGSQGRQENFTTGWADLGGYVHINTAWHSSIVGFNVPLWRQSSKLTSAKKLVFQKNLLARNSKRNITTTKWQHKKPKQLMTKSTTGNTHAKLNLMKLKTDNCVSKIEYLIWQYDTSLHIVTSLLVTKGITLTSLTTMLSQIADILGKKCWCRIDIGKGNIDPPHINNSSMTKLLLAQWL